VLGERLGIFAAADTVRVAWARPLASTVQLLSGPESARIAGLRCADDRARSATGRVLLRALVARMLGVEPTDVRIEARCATCGGAHGQPRVVSPSRRSRLHVSVAHAADRVVVAASRGARIGVDVEPADAARFAGFDSLALTPAERDGIDRLRVDERPTARTSLWVRKEALLKVDGTGLSTSPSDVAADPARGVRLAELDVGAGYAAWLAVRTRHRPQVIISDARTWPEIAATPARTARP
jgi:4'-phosphopantetheinyl transferase